MCPDESKWLLTVVREHGDRRLTRLVMEAFCEDPDLVLLAPIEGTLLGYPVDVLLGGEPIPAGMSRSLFGRSLLPDYPEAHPARGRPPSKIIGRIFPPADPEARPGAIATDVQIREMIARSAIVGEAQVRAKLRKNVGRVWSYVREAVVGLPREAPAGRVVVDGKSQRWVETPERIDVQGFPLVLGCWLLHRRGHSYSKIAERLRAVVPRADVADVRPRAARYVRAAKRVIFRVSKAQSNSAFVVPLPSRLRGGNFPRK